MTNSKPDLIPIPHLWGSWADSLSGRYLIITVYEVTESET